MPAATDSRSAQRHRGPPGSLAVLADDAGRPDLSTDADRRAAIRILNSRLPKTRTIAQGPLRNEVGEILRAS